MIVNYENIKAAFDGFKAVYFDALSKVPEDWRGLATELPAAGPTLTLDWMGDVPAMREWLGERNLRQLAAYKYQIVVKDWESTIEIDRNYIEDDSLGLFKPKIQDLALAPRRHIRKLLFELLKNGFSSYCYDGQYFFDDDHSEGASGSQSNLGTSALSMSTLQAAIAAMMNFKSDRGEFLEIIPDTLVVPPALVFTAKEIVKATTVVIRGTTDTTAPNYNALADYNIKVIPNPYLTDTDDWFLLATNYSMKPLVLVNRRAPEFNQQVDPNTSYPLFMQKKFLFGIDGRYEAGYGLWQLAYGAHVSG